jgi:hypothetical protein
MYGYSPYSVNYGNPISYDDPYGDCPNCVAAGIGAVIGGVGNLIYQGVQGNLKNPGDYFAAFGIGALAGAAAGFTGGATLAGMGGAASATTLGSAIGTGAAVGGVGGATAGAIEGAGNALVFQNANAGEAFGAGIRGVVYGGLSGAALGGIGGGIGYYANKVGQHFPGNLDTGVGTGGSGGAGGVAGGRARTPVIEVADLTVDPTLANGLTASGARGIGYAGEFASYGVQLSKASFGHTFIRHGLNATRYLIGRGRATGMPQGQWLDEQAAARFIQANAHKAANGAIDVPLPSHIRARVIMPQGYTLTPTHARLVPGNRFVKTAYPIVKPR